MFDGDVLQFLNPEFLFGFVGGIVVTAWLVQPMKSFVRDKMGRALKHWENVGCAAVIALVVALAWSFRTGTVSWNEIPGNVIVYTAVSGFVYENVIKRWIEKRNKKN